MLQDPQVLGNDHNKPHSLMSDPISTMYFHNMFCDLLNKILFKPKNRLIETQTLRTSNRTSQVRETLALLTKGLIFIQS